MFILRETFIALRRTPLMSVMTAFVLAVALAVIGVFGIIIIRAHDTLTEFRSNLVIEAYFNTHLSSDQASAIAERDMKTLPAVTSYTFVSREEALKEYERQTKEDVTSALGYNPLPASARVTMNNLTSETARQAENAFTKIEGVEKVTVDHKTLAELENRQKGLLTLAAGIGGLLLLAALVIVAATIRLAMHARRDAVRTMRLLGATRTTIIAPFILEGTIAGMIGSVLGIALAHAIITYGLPMLMPEMQMTLTMRQEYIVLAGSIAITGVLLTILSSAATAFSLIRKTR
jgi:cell division transport system permease protein